MKAFISYSHHDAELLEAFHRHLAALRRQDLITAWTDREIPAGGIIDEHVEHSIESADLYLLLISASFLDSNYCFEKEFKRALERHAAGQAIIVPIIIKPCDWKVPELKQFKTLPKDGKAVTGSDWKNIDEALTDVVSCIRQLIERVTVEPTARSSDSIPPLETATLAEKPTPQQIIVSSTYQSGGITAHTVNVGNAVRTLAPEQQAAIIKMAKLAAGTTITLSCPMGNSEAIKYTEQFKNTLVACGFVINGPLHCIWSSPIAGIWIRVKDVNPPPAAGILQHALKGAGIEAGGVVVTDLASELELIIGDGA